MLEAQKLWEDGYRAGTIVEPPLKFWPRTVSACTAAASRIKIAIAILISLTLLAVFVQSHVKTHRSGILVCHSRSHPDVSACRSTNIL